MLKAINRRINIQKQIQVELLLSVFMIIASALSQAYIIQVFMNPCNLIAGGFTGTALLLNKALLLLQLSFPVSLGILLLNVPAILICYHYVSKRFTWLSCLQFVLVSFFLEVLQFHPLFTDKLLNILFGGVLWGCSLYLALKAGGSSGGTDFIIQFISSRIHKNIWKYVFIFNCFMLIIYGVLFGWEHAGYSIIFQFISTRILSGLYQQYDQITIEITTKNPDKVIETFMKTCHHGMSVLQGYGGYSNQHIFLCKSVISNTEVREVINAVRESDTKVIINTYRTEQFYGPFYRKPLK